MKIPTHPVSLMKKVYRDVFPSVHRELAYWKQKADSIPDPELRKQALASIQTKTFHCEGGAILALLAEANMEACIRFIVAYQTISDYLDNLCDRSTSLDPLDFRALHESMPDALSIDADVSNYYRHRNEQDDGGYLHELVRTCQGVLKQVKHYEKIVPFLQELAGYYCDLQVHKHVRIDERVPRLEQWFKQYKNELPPMEWYEFSACSGSTLGIFCLVAYAFTETFNEEMARQVRNGYFPYIQGLHILLDYFIDQEEDRLGGDLNFCFYYPNQSMLIERLCHFIEEADRHVGKLPHGSFHRLIHRGLLGLYLSDEKVKKQKEIERLAKQLVQYGGMVSRFFYWNGKAYRMWQKMSPLIAK
ncbi:tetraprenyl-beta-curcumene synthase family protein [Thermaerobacillus caldiproteolyticus]|uniref:tetraprenyl-beta-curcumene synthase family protein n=1 Tax=Thermaerobacillus caldiproteolyticus TaxID=247480 RepID=UPI00188D865F|nr:tetraprenyl-beta-curcumene synthase family protein [Anoxybacillus caldiproteolyticus]QPA30430.1 tetraprenyl-beta-curcumene synthase family protein [Anoxybacillus caldiproteolyticus]